MGQQDHWQGVKQYALRQYHVFQLTLTALLVSVGIFTAKAMELALGFEGNFTLLLGSGVLVVGLSRQLHVLHTVLEQFHILPVKDAAPRVELRAFAAGHHFRAIPREFVPRAEQSAPYAMRQELDTICGKVHGLSQEIARCELRRGHLSTLDAVNLLIQARSRASQVERGWMLA